MSSSRVSATRVGLFTIGGLVLLAAVIISVFGARVFANTERAVMYFQGSVFGLQKGAGLVFRGVRIGSVRSIGVVRMPQAGEFEIPVEAVIDLGLIGDEGGSSTAATPLTLTELVAAGLTARLAQQSMLTGQLYIDLDLRPGVPASSAHAAREGILEIPTTVSTSLSTVMRQLAALDLSKLVKDLSATAASVRELAGSPQLRQSLDNMVLATAALGRLGSTLERRVSPLAEAAQGTLGEIRSASAQAGQAIGRVGVAADRMAGAAGRIEATLAAESPLLGSVQRAADELTRSAQALQRLTADDSVTQQTLHGVQQTLSDVSRASRAMRELAEVLERQPDALIRGRSAPP